MSKLLEVKDLRVSFNTYNGEVQAVRGVNFELNKGETLAIVGESGSGKSVTSKSLMQLLPAPQGFIKSGEILFEGKDITKLSNRAMQKIRGSEISMIFQDRSEEHTSELQSRGHLVCRLLLEKKKYNYRTKQTI